MTSSDMILQDLATLAPADQEQVRGYIAYLRWRAEHAPDRSGKAAGPARLEDAARPWRFNFLEHLASAEVRASKDPAGMEVKLAEATVGGERRPALWQHPPVSSEALAEFHVPIPAGLRDLRLRFHIGVRDGAQGDDRLVAFRVKVGGWQVWSRAAWPQRWEAFELPLPFQAGNMLRLAFATDGLGAHPWAWAAWGEPELLGTEA